MTDGPGSEYLRVTEEWCRGVLEAVCTADKELFRERFDSINITPDRLAVLLHMVGQFGAYLLKQAHPELVDDGSDGTFVAVVAPNDNDASRHAAALVTAFLDPQMANVEPLVLAAMRGGAEGYSATFSELAVIVRGAFEAAIEHDKTGSTTHTEVITMDLKEAFDE